jgi:hypothetical protein
MPGGGNIIIDSLTKTLNDPTISQDAKVAAICAAAKQLRPSWWRRLLGA